MLKDKKTRVLFASLIENKDFRNAVKQARMEINSGINWSVRSQDFIEDSELDKDKHLVNYYKALDKIGEKFHLPKNLEPLVGAYLKNEKAIKDVDNLLSEGITPNFEAFRTEINFDHTEHNQHRVEVYIYPGATQRGVKEFVSNLWPIIETRFKQKYPKIYKVKIIREKLKQKRDREIYKLYRFGVIKYGGEFDLEKADKYLSSLEEGRSEIKTNILRRFMLIGLDLPGQPGRKRAIQKMRKLMA